MSVDYNKIIKALTADLVAMMGNFPIEERADNREIWRRQFDRIQMDIERVIFARKLDPAENPPASFAQIETGFY